MLAVIAHGEDTFRLVDTTGRDVGWVRPNTIGFSGFISRDAARGAALDGARALVRSLKREFGMSHMELSDAPRARTVRDGDAEWITDGNVRIARLLRVENGGCGQEFAIEYRLPSYANHAVAINAAQIVYSSLSRELTGTSGPTALRAAYDAVG